jgi:hypothetical protein
MIPLLHAAIVARVEAGRTQEIKGPHFQVAAASSPTIAPR